MIKKVFGTGGIGTGMFFLLEENRPLSRNESRSAVLTDYKDYCKGHIILHYVSVLSPGVKVCILGKVGDDENGETLLRKMQKINIDTRYVQKTKKAPTLFSACFQYPDGTGGNITSINSASGLVTPEYIENCISEIDAESLVLAAPEVPLESRIRLLEIGRERGAFTAASFTSEEAAEFEKAGGFALTDFLSVNRDEAASVCDAGVHAAAGVITEANPSIKLAITDGEAGSHLFAGGGYRKLPGIPAKVVSTAGAGDAFFGGTIAGLISGKDFFQAASYGVAAAYFAVMSEDTIAQTVSPGKIETFLKEEGSKYGL